MTKAFVVPERLKPVADFDGGREWLDRLPSLVEEARDRFKIERLEDPFDSGNVSYALPGEQDGAAIVLKIQFPDAESRHEADALRAWDGNGAVKLIDHDGELAALLLERCFPGTLLADSGGEDPVGIMAGLIKRLAIPVEEPFRQLREQAELWREDLSGNWSRAGKPCEKYLVDAAYSLLGDLASNRTEEVLLHQDLHGHNVLAAERERWLAIDPKPLRGDLAFAVSPVVRSFELGHSEKQVLYRLDRLCEELGIDRERAQAWTIGQTMAWSFSSDFSERHFDTTRWLLNDPRF